MLPSTSWIKHAAFIRRNHVPHFEINQNYIPQQPIPPWCSQLATVCTSLPQGGKAHANPNTLRTDALERIDSLNHGRDAIFYTDGPVTHDPDRAGAGLVVRSQNYHKDISIRVSDHASSLQA